MKELRDIKLDLLMGNQNPIVDLFNKITNDLQIINTNVYNEEGLEFIYYQPFTNEWIFYQDVENDKFWCNFATYWSFFEYKLGLEYLEIQAITKYLVEEALKREVTTPTKYHIEWRTPVEEALKREVTTPNRGVFVDTIVVEEALKLEISNPKPEIHKMDSMVLNALKRDTEKE